MDHQRQPPSLPDAKSIKLILCDVDGTLLTSEHILHPRTKAAVIAVKGVRPELPFVICTGKQLSAIDELRGPKGLQINPSHPCICCQGAMVYGPNGNIVVQRTIDAGIVAQVIEALRDRACFIFLSESLYLVSSEPHLDIDWIGISKKYDKNVYDAREPSARADLLGKIAKRELDVVKITIGTDPNTVHEIYEILEPLRGLAETPHFVITRAVPFIVEVTRPDAIKSIALLELCDSLGLSPDQVLAFGDGENDTEMLRTAGWGVAMANAVPPTKDAADYITLSNDEGGVGAFLEKIFPIPPWSDANG